MAGVAKLLNACIHDKSYGEIDLNDRKYRGYIIGLYFSADWCPPCHAFTPLLTELYEEFGKEKRVKVIYISSDHDEQSFRKYYRTMPWFALDFKDRKKREVLLKKFQVDEIPKLILLDGDTGDIICTNAKEQILYLDIEGKNFPWGSK